MQLEFRTRRVPITMDIVKRDLKQMGMLDEVSPEDHLKFIEDIQCNILDKHFDEDAFIRSVLFCDMDLKYNGVDEVSLTDMIVAHAEELTNPAHRIKLKELEGDGTLGSNILGEHLGTLFGCYPIDVYLIDEKSGNRVLVSKSH
ncbi:MAG: hypothetical protein PHV62_05895 [Sulfuricurvum sp.]|nr:hypothetical protein [Sulfuricurvum sp.]